MRIVLLVVKILFQSSTIHVVDVMVVVVMVVVVMVVVMLVTISIMILDGE